MQTLTTPRPPEAKPLPSRRRWAIPLVGLLVIVAAAVAVFAGALALLWSGEQVDVGGRNMFVLCRGDGEPTVLIEHGLGADGTDWRDIQETLSEETTVCFTTRAGRGFSDPPDEGTRTAADAVDDLDRALAALDIDGPYLLVGHSFGGYVSRLFADRHTGEIAGVVLVDSSHPDREILLGAQLSEDTWNEVASFFGSDNPEQMDLIASAEQVKRAGDLGDLPLIVLQAGGQNTDAEAAGISQERADELDAVMESLWSDLQRDLATLSTAGRHQLVADSGHFIHRDQPDVVIDAIRSILERGAG